MLPLAPKSFLAFVAVFIAAALGFGVLVDWFNSRDPALAGAIAFAERQPGVESQIGKQVRTSVTKSLYYEGVPGREEPYREYTIRATGETGSVTVWVRATGPDSSGAWKYQVREVEPHR